MITFKKLEKLWRNREERVWVCCQSEEDYQGLCDWTEKNGLVTGPTRSLFKHHGTPCILLNNLGSWQTEPSIGDVVYNFSQITEKKVSFKKVVVTEVSMAIADQYKDGKLPEDISITVEDIPSLNELVNSLIEKEMPKVMEDGKLWFYGGDWKSYEFAKSEGEVFATKANWLDKPITLKELNNIQTVMDQVESCQTEASPEYGAIDSNGKFVYLQTLIDNYTMYFGER